MGAVVRDLFEVESRVDALVVAREILQTVESLRGTRTAIAALTGAELDGTRALLDDQIDGLKAALELLCGELIKSAASE